ncbi:MAG: hypothetical protein Q9170_002653 [Blastenia crenularia]
MATAASSWGSLPPEIRSMIMKALVEEDWYSFAQYATVCREWQPVIEHRIFNRLKLTPSRLASFSNINPRQKTLVEYIWFCVELQEYECPHCEEIETEVWHEKDTNIIKAAMRELFRTLSTWDRSGDLVLDISVYSPSDFKHHFKHLSLGSDVFPGCREMAGHHDPRHGWVDGLRIKAPPEDAIRRLFEDIEMESDFWRELPKVTAVTSLLLRRQTPRRWEPGTLEELFNLLPGLQEIHYEPWREWGLYDQRLTDKMLFEDFQEDYVAVFPRIHPGFDATPIRIPNYVVSEALAKASLELEHLSASFMVDAVYFFQARRPSWAWKHLVSLVLTSRLLVPSEDHAEINLLFQAAAVTAMKMPSLRTMELWNGRRGLACVFRYQASEGNFPAKIIWRGTWDIPLEPKVVHAWETVATQHARCDLLVIKEPLDKTMVQVRSHGDAIDQLEFLRPVVHPVSLRQLRAETTL